MAARRMVWTGPALIAVMLLAFAVRIWRLEAQSLWYDEGVTAEIARRGLAELTRWTANDIQPPLYYYVVAGWGRIAGWSEFSLRFPSVVFGVLAVPLMAVLTLRLTRRYSAALLAALFTAVHPLLVYYSQEARMYTLLVTLGILAGYLLVRLADRAGRGWPLWAGYVSVAAAAIYTHYFAFFLLLGLGLAYGLDALWRWKKRPTTEVAVTPSPWSPVLYLLAANGLVLLLYLPWITAMITRLRVDRSYWSGTLKLHEALLHVAVSFTSGETVAERLAVWLLAVYGLVTLWAVVRLWRSGASGRRVLLYGGLWLITPVAAVLALSMNLPKFNARYVMVALPGLILLWAGGLGGCGQSDVQAESRQPFSTGQSTRFSAYLPVVASLLLVAGFTFADANWFLNAAFTKDEWREAAAFLRERIRADERIVLVSGHAWPVWNYYAPDMPVVRLPPIEVLDVDAVLGFEDTGPALKMAFDDSTGKKRRLAGQLAGRGGRSERCGACATGTGWPGKGTAYVVLWAFAPSFFGAEPRPVCCGAAYRA